MTVTTLEEYIATYGDPDQPWPVVEAAQQTERWPAIIVKAGDKVAVLHLINVAADDPDKQHLCIDVRSFVAGRAARAGVFGMESGRRLVGFADAEVAGTSHRWPATQMVAVLVGAQAETTPSEPAGRP
ncbi:MAG: hypothetical protein J2P15_08715 [Micromonosporaceae bacterium]|nr:hypothetical protein [Micromonosporaceae bacterium]